jgi:hypothetical protein
MAELLPYNPGVLPSWHAPSAGDSLELEVPGLPPYKDEHFSIRNPQHPRYEAFVALRDAATTAMNGRAWYFGPVELDLVVFAPELHNNRRILDYVAGVEDTIDGSSGCHFTYLPIVFEDDCQVVKGCTRYIPWDETKYVLRVTFL